MPHNSRKNTSKQSSKSGDVARVPSLYSISANFSPSKANRSNRNSHASGLRGFESDYENARNTVAESIMMGQLDKWNATTDSRNDGRANSPDYSVSEVDRERPVAFVHPIVHRSPETELLRSSDLRLPPASDAKPDIRSTTPSSDFTAYAAPVTNSSNNRQNSQSIERPEVVLEEFDNSLFILCVVSIFINPVLGAPATFAAWRAKQAFFSASWKSFRRWTIAAHALSSIGFGLAAIAFGMIGIKLYHMYSGIQCFYKCSFLTNNEFNWQGFWDELSKNRGGA